MSSRLTSVELSSVPLQVGMAQLQESLAHKLSESGVSYNGRTAFQVLKEGML